MKVTFVYPDLLLHRNDWPGYFYVGLATLSAVLKERGHRTSLLHMTRRVGRDEFVGMIRAEDPDLVAFSVTSHMFTFLKEYVTWMRDAGMTVPTICGGIHPTIAPEETLGLEGIDIICRSEGETALSALCEAMEAGKDYSRIPNLWVKRNGTVARNPVGPGINDLDTLPFPDRSIWDYTNLYGEREGRASFYVSRGCPYNCTYCCNHLQRKINGKQTKSLRFRSVGHVIAEIKEVLRDYPSMKSLIFDDDILFLKKAWSEEFTERYSREIGLPFVCNARANLVDPWVADLLKKAGCYHVKFGIESGNDYIANQVLDRRLTSEQVKKAFALCKRAGLITESFQMVGVPFETPAATLDTIKLNAAIGVDRMQVMIYQPYRGTALAELSQAHGFTAKGDVGSDFFSPSEVKLDSMAPSQVLMFRDYFKIFVRYYQLIGKLPADWSNWATDVSDRVLHSIAVSKVLNRMYRPANYLFRKLQHFRTGTRVAHHALDALIRFNRGSRIRPAQQVG